MADSRHDKLIVAAIDFGTTYSGWAFSFRHDYESDPTRISVKNWHSGQNISLKAPTTVLIKPDGVTLEAFGYDAEDRYSELAANNEHREYYFFKCFKMMLHGQKNLTRNTKLADDKRNSLNAMTVFSLAIKYLKEDLMTVVNQRSTNATVDHNDVHWVLTVPAIWNDSAKQFMRESAHKCGIPDENLTIALEPEAASIFCKLLPVDLLVKTESNADISAFKPGSKYMILDAGGGTVDITVHEVIEGGKLKELFKASGGACGGTKVDESFRKMLVKIFGELVFQTFQDDCTEDYLEMLRDFEIKKRKISPDDDKQITLRIAPSLADIYQGKNKTKWSESVNRLDFSDKVTTVGDKLRLDAQLYKELFEDAIQETVHHVTDLMANPAVKSIDAILMVGGFSDSPMLQSAIRQNFPSIKLVIPEDAGLAVIKGAVVYGHDPSGISERVCKFTYGVDVAVVFDHTKHRENKITIIEGILYCNDIFDKHVEIGQSVKYGVSQATKTYVPLTETQTKIPFDIFATSNKDVTYVDEFGCRKLGTVEVELRDMSVPKESRTVKVSFIFSGTELEVKAVEEATGLVTKTNVNFLG